MNKKEREERAFEALIVKTLRQIDYEDVDIDSLPELNDKEKRALEKLGPDFIENLLREHSQ